MRYRAEIKINGDAEKIIECFEPELSKKDRSSFDIKKQKDHVLIEVEASDSVALRATLNAITKLLTVYENIEKVD